jgi:hypothetical protein
MSFKLLPLALTFAIIIFAVPLMPVFAVPESNQAPLGLAEFNILDFTQTYVTWSLQVTLDGNRTSDILAIQTLGGIIFQYYAQYDRNLDTTTIKKIFVSPFSSINGEFPYEQWILQVSFAINCSLTNLPVGDFSMQLPTINYNGVLFISQSQGTSELSRYGKVYSLTAYITRNAGVASQLQVSMINFPLILSYLSWVLVALIPLDYALFLLKVVGKYKTTRGSLQRIVSAARRIGQINSHFLDAKFFTIVIGVLFFLPIYEISLRSLEIPIPITQGDTVLINLTKFFALILLWSFVASLIASERFARLLGEEAKCISQTNNSE